MRKMAGIILVTIGALLIIIGIIFIRTNSNTTTNTNLAEVNIPQANLPGEDIDHTDLPEKDITHTKLPIKSIANAKGSEEDITELDNIFDLALADGILTEGEKRSIKEIAQRKNLDYDKILVDLEDKLRTNGIEAETQLIDRNKQNGDEFEKFVVQKFSKKYFKIKEWAGDKYVNGIYAENTLHPDILLEFKLKDISKRFSVECKWRKELKRNGLEFAKPDQLERYKKYETEKGIPVFIAIGVQGKASDPESLFIVPLKEAKTTFLSYNTLKKYEKDKTENFFFDPNTETLK